VATATGGVWVVSIIWIFERYLDIFHSIGVFGKANKVRVELVIALLLPIQTCGGPFRCGDPACVA
jgi:hypothetical protein